jgi:hypothetical protein
MASGMYKYLGTSNKYSYVCKYEDRHGNILWQGKRFNNGKFVETERGAALNVDKELLSKGKEPINILVRK